VHELTDVLYFVGITEMQEELKSVVKSVDMDHNGEDIKD